LNVGDLIIRDNTTTKITISRTTGTINTVGNLLSTNLTGTLLTAAQTNITSVGTLGSLAVTGAITSASLPASGTVLWGTSASRTQTKNDAGAIASKSGFFETSAPTNYYAGASSWQHMFESRHSNDGNNYALQIAGSFFDQILYFEETFLIQSRIYKELLKKNDL
jgi:hypothetical protein